MSLISAYTQPETNQFPGIYVLIFKIYREQNLLYIQQQKLKVYLFL